VGRTLGSGLRDFRQAINGESVHDDREPHAYVEPEPDPVPLHDTDASETEPETPTALHEHQLDPEALGDDLHAPVATEDLHPPAADDLPAIGDLHAPGAHHDLHAPGAHHDLPEPVAIAEPDSAPPPVAVASSSGFASALASSRQRPADGGEPAADDE